VVGGRHPLKRGGKKGKKAEVKKETAGSYLVEAPASNSIQGKADQG